MAKIIVAARTFADIQRGDVISILEDGADEGRDVRALDIFRVVRVPGPASMHEALGGLTRFDPALPPPKNYFAKTVDLDSIEAAETSKLGRSLKDNEECAVASKAIIDALASVKPVEVDEIVLPGAAR